MNDSNNDTQGPNTRRAFLASVAAAGLGVAALGLSGAVEAATTPQQPEADSGHNYPFPMPQATTEKEYREGIIPIVSLSHIISELAVDRAVHADTKEFANFELRETIAVLGILKAAGTPTPPFDATVNSILVKVKSSHGIDFDKAYIGALEGGHEYLRDLTELYLSNSDADSSPVELHVRDLAKISLAFFKEHLVIAKRIKSTLPS